MQRFQCHASALRLYYNTQTVSSSRFNLYRCCCCVEPLIGSHDLSGARWSVVNVTEQPCCSRDPGAQRTRRSLCQPLNLTILPTSSRWRVKTSKSEFTLSISSFTQAVHERERDGVMHQTKLIFRTSFFSVCRSLRPRWWYRNRWDMGLKRVPETLIY